MDGQYLEDGWEEEDYWAAFGFGPEDYRPGGFATLMLKLEEHGHLTGSDLALMMEANRGRDMPDELHTYLIRHLRGAAPRKRGRKAGYSATKEFELHEAADLYHRALPRLQRGIQSRKQAAKAQRRVLPKGEPSAYQLALELAARAVNRQRIRRGDNEISWETLKNELSRGGLLSSVRSPCRSSMTADCSSEARA